MRRPKEKVLYPSVRRWLEVEKHCFRAATNVGLLRSRIDVVGVRDVGGELSGEIELIAVEVKRGTEPFATACGQAASYRVYAHRVYLADFRSKWFDEDEIDIATHLGIGLMRITRMRRCKEELSSPYARPIPRMHANFIERLGLGFCRICGSCFPISSETKRAFDEVTRERLTKAIDEGKGMMFWNGTLSNRKRDLGITNHTDERTYERRYICPDCVERVLSQLACTK